MFSTPLNSQESLKSNEMDEETKGFLKELNALQAPPLETLSVEEVRKYVNQFVQPPSIPLGAVEDLKIPGPHGEIPIRIYTPEGQGPFPVYITLHGGGWVFGTLDLHDPFCRNIAQQANVLVVSVDYRLAPENKYPIGLIDCYTAACWVVKEIKKWNGIPSRLAIGGDSAGGNLTAAVTLMARDKKFPHFHNQVLIYPVLEHKFDTPSYQKFEQNYFLTKNQMKWFWNLYLTKNSDSQEPYAAPLLAKDFKYLPPALIVLAEFDPLFSEGIDYGKKLEEAGVPVQVLTYPTIHVFVSKSDQLKIGKKAISDIAAYIKGQLYENR